MTVPTITDDQVAELERASTFVNRCMVEVSPASLVALLAERAELNRDVDHFRSALTKLSQVPGCGCDFPCRCGGAEWTRHELEGRIDYAIKALETMQEQPS